MLQASGRWAAVWPLLILTGCRGVPEWPSPVAPPQPPGPTIQFFGEVEATESSVGGVVRQHIPPGMPVDQAITLLQGQGFTCDSGEKWNRFTQPTWNPNEVLLPREALGRVALEKMSRKVFFNATKFSATDEWRTLPYHLHAVVIIDEARAVRSVDVGLRDRPHPSRRFFEKHPEVHSPAGLPLQEARVRMTSYGFLCRDEERGGDGKDVRPRVSCEYFAENALGGNIIRVSLVADESRVVREVVVEAPGWFDAERCMLPQECDSTAWAISKIPLYPVRLLCRYAAYTLALAVAGAAH